MADFLLKILEFSYTVYVLSKWDILHKHNAQSISELVLVSNSKAVKRINITSKKYDYHDETRP